MSTKGEDVKKEEKINPDVERTPEELREEVSTYSKKMEANFASIIDAKEKINELKNGTVFENWREGDILEESENKDSENFKLAKAIAEQIKIKNKAQKRNNNLKKKLGQFIEELYNDIKKKIEDLSKESKELETKQQSGEELTEIEKNRILELKRELRILGEELKFLEREIRKLRQEVEKLIGDGPSEKKKGSKKVAPTSETREGETPAEETPAEETPAEETPAEETPAEETPAEETPAEPEASAEETPAEPEASAEETPAEGAPATATASPVTVAPAAGTSVGGGSGTARRTEHSSDGEKDRRSERDVKKEKYLKLKDICDRLNMTDDELAAAGKEKVNEEEIKSLDKEFEKIYKGMLNDPESLNKWDKRILASMLCKDRYYENTAEDKRAKFYLETKIKGIGPRILAWLKKMPKSMTEHKELLGKMVEFVENDRELEDDLKNMEKTDCFEDVKAVRDAVASAINKWNAAVTKDEAKCTATLTAGTSLAEELSDRVSPESPEGRVADEIVPEETVRVEIGEDYVGEWYDYEGYHYEEYGDDEYYAEEPVAEEPVAPTR